MIDTQITLQDVSYTYLGGKLKVLDGINIEIKAGEFIGILGSNGAGRTTLCYCMNGLIPNTLGGKLEGEVTIFGKRSVDSTTPKIAQRVGFVFSDPSAQLTQPTVAEEVSFGPANLGVPKEEINEIVKETLELVGLDGLNSRSTGELSGGQQQRLAIASALSMKPQILILDEPTSNLDPIGTEEVFSTITNLNKEHNTTIIIIENDIDLLAEHASRLLVIEKGKLIADGVPGDVFEQLNNREYSCTTLPQVTQLAYQLKSQNILTMHPIPIRVNEAYHQVDKFLRDFT